MKNFRIVLMAVLISVSLAFAGQIGPWSHFKAITSNFTVAAGDTLTIDAGTQVRFSQGTIMTVFGVVLSNGTSSNPVIFAALDPTNPYWGGITIKNTDPSQVSVFNSTVFTKMYSYGDGGINIEESSVNFNNCRFIENHADVHGGAVYAVAGNVNFNLCVFKNNHADQGGALYVYNQPSDAASTIGISYCRFLENAASYGGALYVEDYDGAPFNMTMVIENSGFHYNKAIIGDGGAVYFNVLSHLDLRFKYCKIQYNNATMSGGGIYAKFFEMDYFPNNVLPQEFANLLVTENVALDGGGIYFNTGFTQNPMNIDFVNTTIAYNYILAGKQSKDFGGGGIHIVYNDNFPVIRNSIIWENGNEWYKDEFLLTGNFPNPTVVFEYCDIGQGAETGPDGLSIDPKFVRDPEPFAITGDLTIVDADRFDYHLSLNSPCIDTGDPETPINPSAAPEVMYPPVNMGAYGNTSQAAIPIGAATQVDAGATTNINIPDGEVVVLNFQGKAKEFSYDLIELGAGSQLHLQEANLADINIKQFITPIQTAGKFNYERIVIQKISEEADLGITKVLNISEKAILHGVELSDMQLAIAYDPTSGGIFPEVSIVNSIISNSDSLELVGIEITDADSVIIINTKVDNFSNGIQVLSGGKNKGASGRITNNTITFDVGASQKAGQQIGVQVQNQGDIDIEYNDIEDGDIGIQMSNSGGRITNNTITFDVGASQKTKLGGRIAIDVIGGTNAIVEDNDIWIADSTSALATGINVESSSAQIYYNKINFYNPNSLTRNGIVFNDVLNSTYAYNNTIYNPTVGVSNTSGSYSIDFINNIIWNDNSDAGVSDTTNIRFFNNDIKTLGDISGNNNISSDPLCIDPSTNDLVISTSPIESPCLNAGYTISGFHIANSTYYGEAPEIGAVEYYEVTLTAPGEVTVGVTDSTFTFGWGAVTGATSYTIYASGDPYAAFDSVATVVTTSWSTQIGAKKFFYVIANDASKNVNISNEPTPYDQIKEKKGYKVIKKNIIKKIKKRTESSNR